MIQITVTEENNCQKRTVLVNIVVLYSIVELATSVC